MFTDEIETVYGNSKRRFVLYCHTPDGNKFKFGDNNRLFLSMLLQLTLFHVMEYDESSVYLLHKICKVYFDEPEIVNDVTTIIDAINKHGHITVTFGPETVLNGKGG